ACEAGENFATSNCNNKLIRARYFVDGFGRQNLHAGEFLSPRDSNGHGSHTASTAAGNYGVEPVVAGSDLGVDLISGIAPRAYIEIGRASCRETARLTPQQAAGLSRSQGVLRVWPDQMGHPLEAKPPKGGGTPSKG